jgi:hypothetical protein
MTERRKRTDRPRILREPATRYETGRAAEVWAAFESLSPEEREAFLGRLLEDDDLREDLMDSIVMIERRGEPGRPFEEFVQELRREGSL